MAEWVTIGTARLALGDSREILPSLGPVDHIITDPPYGQGTHENHDANVRCTDGNRSVLPYSFLTEEDVAALADLFVSASSGWIVWFSDADLSPHIRAAYRRNGRANFAPVPFYHHGRSVRLSGDGPSSWTDWINVCRTPALRKWGTLRGGYISGDGWNDKARKGGKPTQLMGLVVSDYSRRGDLVCDPFMGAGTTGIACIKQDRRFIGIEIDPEAFETSCKRIEEAHRQGDLFGAAAA